MLVEPLMAGAHEDYQGAMIPNESDEADEKASLKASNALSTHHPTYGSTDNVYTLLHDKASNDNLNSAGGGNANYKSTNTQPKCTSPLSSPKHSDPTPVPSLTRRMSSQFVMQVERQRSVVDNMGLTDKVNQFVPDAITQHIPGLARRQSSLRLTYFCNICFTKNDIDSGFTLRRCQHQFCPECVEGYMNSKINHGVVNLTCFYPLEGSKPCGEKIDEEDIHQTVGENVWNKYEKFKANSQNTYSRQCPYCDHTQIGDPEHPMMTCENSECGKVYCLEHSNAHDMEMLCEEYELIHQKETKMNEMAIEEMGDNVKPCPQCKFRILKNGGCNHMKCVQCNCSFCWLCLEIIADDELPQHYKDDNSPCKGKQFEGMEGEPPPRWIMALLVICIAIFCIPSTVLGIAFGIVCFPLVFCCGCTNENGERQSLWETMFGCWLIWLIIFVMIAVFIPLLIFYIIWEVIRAIYGVIRLCLPCLPACPARNAQPQPQQQPGGAGGGGPNDNMNDNDNNNNNNNPNLGNQGLLSDSNVANVQPASQV